MRNRLDEAYFLTMGKFAVIIVATAIAGAIVWSIRYYLVWVAALAANWTGIKF